MDLDKTQLTQEQKLQLTRLIGKYRPVFAKDITELGEYDKMQHIIDTGDANPIRQRCYKTSPHMKKIIGDHIDKMCDAGIIEQSTSQWQSPVVMVKKRDGSYRFAVDYRALNKITKPISLPMMSFENVVESLGDGKAKIFSVLDCASGFWQIKLDPSTAHKTAFVSHKGVYQFRRLPFGLMNSPSVFSLAVGDALRKMNWKNLLIYVDDLCIFSKDFDSHLIHLEEVFKALQKANLKIKPEKCQFAKPKIHYLGHIISADGIQVNPDKMAAVKTFPTPKNQKKVRAFLGLCNYYRKFIKGFAHIAVPLNNLLKINEQKFKWTENCENAFNTLKTALTSEPIVLQYPNFDKPFILSTDASDFSIGFILGQEDDSGREKVIAYGGKALNKHQRNYHISEKECLAVFEGIKHYNHFLEGHEFKVITDHEALTHLMEKKEPRNRLGRWVAELQTHNFKIVYRKGQKHTNADGISRREYDDVNQPVTATAPNTIQIPEKISDVATLHKEQYQEYKLFFDKPHKPQVAECNSLQAMMNGEATFLDVRPLDLIHEMQHISSDDLRKLQRDDPELLPFFKHREEGSLPNDENKANFYAAEARHHVIEDGVLYHKMVKQGKGHKSERTVSQLVIPATLRDDVMRSFHDAKLGGGHQGIERTRELIKRKYYWHKMDADIEFYVKSCDICQRTKQLYHGYRAPLRPLPVEDLFQRWHMDILGPLPESQGYKYIILFVDSFSKWCEAFPMKTQLATEVADILYNEIICRYGAPSSILSDRGKNFVSSVIAELCKMFQITRSLTSSYHPATNAQCERLNSVIAKGLRAYTEKRKQKDWVKHLPSVMSAYRMANSSTTGMSPYFIMFGKEGQLPFDVAYKPPDSIRKDYHEYLTERHAVQAEARKEAKENTTNQQQKYKLQYDKKSKRPKFKLGDKVWLFCQKIDCGLSRKLSDKWLGPYLIVALFDDFTFKLQDINTRECLASRVHANRLKIFFDQSKRPTNRPLYVSPHNNLGAHLLEETQISTPIQSQQNHTQSNTNQSLEGTPLENTPTQTKEKYTKEEIDRIIKCVKNKGQYQYRIKFKDSTRDQEWQFADMLPQQLIDEFHVNCNQRGRKRKRVVPQKYYTFRYQNQNSC